MYKLRHIFVTVLSLLIIYTGAGVAIAHYCCTKCDVQADCCQEHACHGEEENLCKDAGCSTVFYRIDLVKEASASLSVSSLWACFYQLLPEFRFASPGRDCPAVAEPDSPPILPRCYLALYSVLLI